jgi:general secretion pathway protein D
MRTQETLHNDDFVATFMKTRTRPECNKKYRWIGKYGYIYKFIGKLILGFCLLAFLQITIMAQEAPAAQPDPILTSKRIRLSYIDPQRCLQILSIYGVKIGSAGKAADLKALPIVHALPSTKFHETLPKQETTFPQTETDPINEIIIFYDANEPAQYSRIITIIEEQIDLPARQIIIEAMVLELSSTALRELGVKWELNRPGAGNFFSEKTVTGGSTPLLIGNIAYPVIDSAAQLDITTTNIFREFNTRLRALVETGSAQVLSRPSVLTLDNRMATINVSEQIPIAKSRFLSNGNFASVDFANVTAGIQLAVRPRINRNGTEVSLQINASVTARVPNADLEIKDNHGNVIARSPTLSVREVKTYTRIANSTPFIIGGLIAEDSQHNAQKIPILGELPVISTFFKSQSNASMKREVIIVITPFVLPENNKTSLAKHMPQDKDDFDTFGNELFRDGYRIRAEDTFDLGYLRENRQLRKIQRIVDGLVSENRDLLKKYPYNRFTQGSIPGESILVHRQIYEVVKRRSMDRNLRNENLIFFKPDNDIGAGFKVQFLDKYIKENGLKLQTKEGGKTALALTYTLRRFSDGVGDILKEPVPEVQILDCPDKAAWRKLLWKLNQAGDGGTQRHTVLLRNSEDMERLKRAIVMKQTIELNNPEDILTLESFSRGRLLSMPSLKKDDIELIDADVARCFFYSEHYYQALQHEIETDIKALQKEIGEDKLAGL